MSNAVVAEGESGVRSSGAEGLAAFSRVAPADVDQAAELIGRIFCPHDLKPLHAASADFYARHNCASFDGFSINYVAYGGAVSIDPGCLERFFLLQIPLSGAARVKIGACDIAAAPGSVASLLSPTIPTQMIWENCAQLILLVERRLVEQRAAALAGKAAQAVEFEPLVDLSTPPARTLQGQLAGLVDWAERNGTGRPPLLAVADRREALLDALLNGQRHSLSGAIAKFSGRVETLPRALRRARDCLHAHAADPLDLAQLADAAGVGVRALQAGFQRHFGASISDMLLDIRLRGLYARLKVAPPQARIIDIAFDLGFTHLGRMAGAYRAKFGETPSATLRHLH